MEFDGLVTLLEHGGLAAVLFLLLQRVMARLDIVTDKLIAILEKQEQIHAAMTRAREDDRDYSTS